MPPLASRISQLSAEGALSVYARAREIEALGHDVIHLELGEPDFHPAGDVIRAVQAALDRGEDRYCASVGIPELRAELADYLRRTRGTRYAADNVVVTPGCKLALFLAMMALIEPGAEVLYPDPGFPIYPSVTRALGGVPKGYSLAAESGFQPDLDEVYGLVTPATRVLIVCSPNNPTGTVYKPEALAGLAEIARRHDLFVISDEIYARLVYDRPFTTMAALAGMEERTVIIDGFSKSFAMTGWRLGYAVAPRAVVSGLDLLVMNSFTCASQFIQKAAVTALRDETGHTDSMLDEYRRRRDEFIAGLNTVPGFRAQAPEGAFYAWVDIGGAGISAEEVQRRLLEDGHVACIPGAAFGRHGAGFLRFSFAGDPALLEKALGRMRTVARTWAQGIRPQKA